LLRAPPPPNVCFQLRCGERRKGGCFGLFFFHSPAIRLCKLKFRNGFLRPIMGCVGLLVCHTLGSLSNPTLVSFFFLLCFQAPWAPECWCPSAECCSPDMTLRVFCRTFPWHREASSRERFARSIICESQRESTWRVSSIEPALCQEMPNGQGWEFNRPSPAANGRCSKLPAILQRWCDHPGAASWCIFFFPPHEQVCSSPCLFGILHPPVWLCAPFCFLLRSEKLLADLCARPLWFSVLACRLSVGFCFFLSVDCKFFSVGLQTLFSPLSWLAYAWQRRYSCSGLPFDAAECPRRPPMRLNSRVPA
jgi:hypothetical protein